MRAVAHIPGLSQTLPPPTRVSEYLNVHDLLASTASEDLTSILLTGFQLVLYATRTRVVKSESADDADDDELDRAAKRLKRQAADAARAVRLSGSLPDIFGSAQKFCTGLAGLHGLLQTAARGLREAHLIPAELKLTYSYALTTRQQELNSLSAKLNVLSAEQWTALRGALQGRFTEAMGMNSGAFSPGLQALLNDASTPPRAPRPNPSTPKICGCCGGTCQQLRNCPQLSTKLEAKGFQVPRRASDAEIGQLLRGQIPKSWNDEKKKAIRI